MKRLLWLSCLCLMTPLAIVGCGDDDSGGNGSEDGGMSSPDIDQINSDIKDINGDVDNLNNDVTGVKKDVGDVQKDVGDLGDQIDDVTSRIDKLENPSVPNCSSSDPGATCVPDGLKVVTKDIGAIVDQLCTLEISCCSKAELALKYGAGIETVADCKSVFFDLLSNGFSPDLFHSGYGYVINNVIEIVQALNDSRVKVSIDTKQVDKCVASLKDHECPKFDDTTVVEPPTHCMVLEESEEDPCSPMLLVKGLQEMGEACDVGYLNVPQCKDKLVCRNDSETENGICSTPAEAGDGCTTDSECDEGLFCNHANAQCEKLGEEGEPCAYIDPTFKVRTDSIDGQINPYNNNQGATSIDCKPTLSCDPKTKKCVAPCSAGIFCYAYEGDDVGGNTQCPDKMVCNVTENPDLRDTWSLGVCRPAVAKGKPCTVGSECVTGNCGFNDSNDMVCLDALTADGGSCDAAGSPDATCKSGYCNVKGKCSKQCVLDVLTEQYGGCASSEFCRYESIIGQYYCEPKGAAGDDCDVTYTHEDISCASGFCDHAMTPTDNTRTGKCAARVAAGAACPSSQHAECPTTQYCAFDGSSTYTCTNFVAEGGGCNTTNPTGDAVCGPPAAYCNQSTLTCHAFGDAGDTCNPATDLRCKTTLTCDPTDLLCRENGKYPDAATCRYDTQCLHGWCSGQTQTAQYCMTAASNDVSCMGKCATPIADGKACDGVDTSKNRCVVTDYCKFPDDDSAGKCVKRLTAGVKCAPRFGGVDCLNMITPTSPGNCVLSNDAFVCDSSAIPDGQLFCDGN